MNKISESQQIILDFYTNYFSKHSRYPSYGEASKLLDKPTSLIFYHVKNLIKKGVMVMREDKTVKVLEQLRKIPILGKIACGSPIEVFEEVRGYIDVAKSMVGEGGNIYALEAVGDSMKDAGINSGDILLIRYQNDVSDGEIAVVIDTKDYEKATLKRVYRNLKYLLLKPENESFPTTTVDQCEIRGKLINVIRQY